ncbi:MAG: M14 family metallopeptidase [Spirochaetaceae bacterium]
MKRVRPYRPLMVIASLSLMFLQMTMASTDVAAQTRSIGSSVEGRRIEVAVFGDGPQDILMVGGIHGAYEANSIALARRFADYYRSDPSRLPERFTLHIIDNMNPDGLHSITGDTPFEEFDFRAVDARSGRFNANGVDLNRNWADDQWRPESTWRNRVVDAGSAPFSEPETRAVRDYFEEIEPVVSVFYQSAGGFIWYSGAEEGWTEALELAEAYGLASGYRVVRPEPRESEEQDNITGSADDYFYEERHRNLTVELTTHYVVEWERNLAGFEALLEQLD